MQSNGFCDSAGPQRENKRNRKTNKYLDLARELENSGTWENVLKGLNKRQEKLGIK